MCRRARAAPGKAEGRIASLNDGGRPRRFRPRAAVCFLRLRRYVQEVKSCNHPLSEGWEGAVAGAAAGADSGIGET